MATLLRNAPPVVVRPLTPVVGAAIDGVDLTRPLTADDVALLRAALRDHLVICLRGQPVSLDDLKRVGRGSLLYLHTVPDIGGDTAFASMYAAHDALSERMKAHPNGLCALHDGARVFAAFSPPEKMFPRTRHPVIRTHPRRPRWRRRTARGAART